MRQAEIEGQRHTHTQWKKKSWRNECVCESEREIEKSGIVDVCVKRVEIVNGNKSK